MSANILLLYLGTNHTENCLSLAYATDLKCYCSSVQFYIALQLEAQEVDVISTVLIQM